MSHGSAWRFGSLRNCQFSSYVGSGYLRAGSGAGVWAVAGEAARTADVTRTKMQRENISVLLHERLGRGHAARHPVFDARIEDSSAENCQESLRLRLPGLVAASGRLIMAVRPNDESPSGVGFRGSPNGTRTSEPRLGSVRFCPKRSPAGYSQSVSFSVTAHLVDRARRRAAG